MPMGYVWSLLSHIQPRATASPNLLLCLDFWILSTESLNLQRQNQFSDIHLASPSLAFSLQSIQSDIYSDMIPDWDCNTKRFWSGASAWHKTNTYLKKVNTYLKPKVLECGGAKIAICISLILCPSYFPRSLAFLFPKCQGGIQAISNQPAPIRRLLLGIPYLGFISSQINPKVLLTPIIPCLVNLTQNKRVKYCWDIPWSTVGYTLFGILHKIRD